MFLKSKFLPLIQPHSHSECFTLTQKQKQIKVLSFPHRALHSELVLVKAIYLIAGVSKTSHIHQMKLIPQHKLEGQFLLHNALLNAFKETKQTMDPITSLHVYRYHFFLFLFKAEHTKVYKTNTQRMLDIFGLKNTLFMMRSCNSL